MHKSTIVSLALTSFLVHTSILGLLDSLVVGLTVLLRFACRWHFFAYLLLTYSRIPPEVFFSSFVTQLYFTTTVCVFSLAFFCLARPFWNYTRVQIKL